MSTNFADYAARGKNSWWRYAVTIGIAFAAQAIITLAAMGIAAIFGIDMDDVPAMSKDASQPVAYFTITGISFAAMLIGFALGAFWLNKKTPTDLIGHWSWTAFAVGFVAWLVLMVINGAIDYALKPQGFIFTPTTLTFLPIALTCLVLALQTFTEEFIFRGFLTQGIYKAVHSPWAASIISGLIFGAVHIPNGIPQAVSAATMGITASWITIRTGGIAFTYGLHLINNVFAAVVVVSSDDVFKGAPALIKANIADLVWVDVSFGAVALGLIVFVMMLRLQAKPHQQSV